MTITAIDLPMEAISKLGDRWQVIEFALPCLVIAQMPDFSRDDLLLPAKREMYLHSWVTGFG